MARALVPRLAPRHCSTATAPPNTFITTPIFYVNSHPHLGHLYTALLADAHARYLRMAAPGARVLLATGTDEHGMKVQQAAAARGLPAGQLCDEVSAEFRQLFDRFGIGYTDYVRTTEARHAAAVAEVWTGLGRSGDLYQAEYSGWYSVPDETFVPEVAVEARGGRHYSLESGHQLEWTSETNWMFRLSRHLPAVGRWVEEAAPLPPQHRAQVAAWLAEGLGDLSVSRPRARLPWGLQVPGDPGHTVYVWVDALTNYLTVAGYPGQLHSWPPDLQVIGKDILKFHAIYWPALLLSLGLALPTRLHVHAHWTVDGVKMSKSLGNVVSPAALADRHSEEGVRYHLLREGVPHADGNFSEGSLVHGLNLELADTLGNLLARATSGGLNPRQEVPAATLAASTATSAALLAGLEGLAARVGAHYSALNFHQGIVAVMEVVRTANLLVQEERPWLLAKEEPERRDWVLALVLETLRVAGLLLLPIVPTTSSRLLARLGVREEERGWSNATPSLSTDPRPLGKEVGVLFSKVSLPKDDVLEEPVKVKPKKKKKDKGS